MAPPVHDRSDRSCSCSAADSSIPLPHLAAAGLDERRRLAVSVARGQRLPFEREQPVTLQIAECAVVGEHVETIGGAFERAARPVATVSRSPTYARSRPAMVSGHPPGEREQLIVGQRRGRVERGGDDLDFALRIEIRQRDLVARLGLDALQQLRGDSPAGPASTPGTRTSVRRDPADRRASGTPGSLSAARGACRSRTPGPRSADARASEQQRLEGLAAAVEADVRLRRGRQHAAQRVERLRPDRRAVNRLSVPARGCAPRNTPASAESSRRRRRRPRPWCGRSRS